MDPLKYQLNQHQHPSSDPQLPLQVEKIQSKNIQDQPQIEDPHIGSFIKAHSEDSENVGVSGEDEFEDWSPEEKKDQSLSIAFTLIGALTLIVGIAFYVRNYVQPSPSAPIPELFVDVSNTNGEFSNQGNLNFSEDLVRKYVENPDYEPSTDGVSTVAQTTKSTSTTASSTTSAFATATTSQGLVERVTSKELGISFLKDPFWSQTVKGKNIILSKVGPEGKNTIYMTRFRGASVTTEDKMNGNVIYFYQTDQKTWMRIDYTGELSEQREFTPEAFTPIKATNERKPILEGTSRTKTLIIALEINDFIIVNISGSGYSAILDSFVNEIRSVE